MPKIPENSISGKHIVDTAWLAANLTNPGGVVLDGSWHLPQEKRDPKAEYAAAHIPGARFFDIDATSDHSSSLPHMLASPEHFAARMKALGVGSDDCVVVYDASAPGLSMWSCSGPKTPPDHISFMPGGRRPPPALRPVPLARAASRAGKSACGTSAPLTAGTSDPR